jgi:crotonobetainyl-CoA:carnitine CoA-transferase CaiB-like acyl-CoA transferase
VDKLTSAGVPAGRVGTIADGFALAEKLGLATVQHMPDGHVPQVAHPIRYSSFRPVPPSVPPSLGEHSEQIRRWLETSADPSQLTHCQKEPP